MSNATTIDVIYSDSLKKVILPIPPINEQINIIDFLRRETGRIDRLIGKIGESVERLGEYRGALISAAVTGKIDVRE
jgi:type I restriction enzyme S subunit